CRSQAGLPSSRCSRSPSSAYSPGTEGSCAISSGSTDVRLRGFTAMALDGSVTSGPGRDRSAGGVTAPAVAVPSSVSARLAPSRSPASDDEPVVPAAVLPTAAAVSLIPGPVALTDAAPLLPGAVALVLPGAVPL